MLKVLRDGPAKGDVAVKQALLEQHAQDVEAPIHAGSIQLLDTVLRPGDSVVEDAIDGFKPKRVREALDRWEKRGIRVISAAQALSLASATIEGLGAGDSRLICGLLPDDEWEQVLLRVRDEVPWEDMFHRGGKVPRRVCVQAKDGPLGTPFYRHPVDEHPPTVPFTPVVEYLRQLTEQRVGQPLNHALVQRYQDGSANISLHADKTLDVLRGTAVINFSIGATRTMVLRPKGGGHTQRVDLPHGSVFCMGWNTNRLFQHGIHPDRRTERERRRDERRGDRISLTFRSVATFLDDGQVAGQGAGPCEDRQAMLAAFGEENRDPEFDWDRWYGEGFSLT